MDYSRLGLLSVAPYFAAFVLAAAAGRTSDWLEAKYGATANVTRKLFNTIGMLGSALSYAGVALVAPTHTDVGNSATSSADGQSSGELAAAALLTLGIGVGACAASAGYWAAFVDISPTHSQVLLALSNSVASLPGVGAGLLTGQILRRTHDDWRLMFTIAAAVQAAGALIFVAGVDLAEQPFEPHDQEASEADGTAQRGRVQPLLVNDAASAASATVTTR